MITLRAEAPGDAAAIHTLTATAFAPMPFADGTEADVIDLMRAAGDLSLSLVAVDGDTILGHVAMSPACVGGTKGWYGLGPISVQPALQRQGIGRRLIKAACDWAREQSAKGVVLLGNPAVYGHAGFVPGILTHREVSQDYVMVLNFTADTPAGEITFADALQDNSP